MPTISSQSHQLWFWAVSWCITEDPERKELSPPSWADTQVKSDVLHVNLIYSSKSILIYLFIDLFYFLGDNFVATLTLGGAGAHATYYHKANDQVRDISSIVLGVHVYCSRTFKRMFFFWTLKWSLDA